MDEKKLFLLDAYALIYRAYYALIRAPRVTSSGFNTSAIFGFCNTLDEILRKENPSHIAVCFDPPHGRTFRHEMYPQYKAQRDAQPEDITKSIPYIKSILEAYCIPILEMERYEADDIIGTLSRKAEAEGYTTYMMTPDKDYGQLVTEKTFMYRPSLRGQGFEIRGPKEICERYGITYPTQVIDLLALEGDASDNIPGCPGVGEKTASKLIREWGSVENLLSNIGSLKGALPKKISENTEQIRFSKQLVTIETNVPIEISVESLVRCSPDIPRLIEIYQELEFRTFISRLNNIDGNNATATAEKATNAPSMPSLFDAFDTEVSVDAAPGFMATLKTTTAETHEDVAKVVSNAKKMPVVGISIWDSGQDAMTSTLRAIAITIGESEVAFIPISADREKASETFEALLPLLKGKSVIVGSDIKRMMVILARHSVEFSAPYFDTSLAHYLLQPEMRNDIESSARTYLNHAMTDSDTETRMRMKPSAWTVEEALPRTAETAQVALQLYPVLKDLVEKQGQTHLLYDIELPFTEVLASMELEGVRIDTRVLDEMSHTLTSRLHILEQQAYDLAGTTFNIGSPSQVGDILFNRLKIDPKAKKTKTGAYATTEEILEKYRSSHPLVDLILEIRGVRKLLTTYVNALPTLINPSTGKIHTTFNQTATATGRISSTNPNLQNIPIRTDEGREIRRAFIADPGQVLLSADYSQIELRLIADQSGDINMVEAFLSGEDIHRATAAKIYHIPLQDVTDDQRRHAKTANFGIIYGISAFGLASRLAIPRAEAKALIDGYMEAYPGVKEYMDKSIERARNDGFVTTVEGRKRYLPDIHSRNAVVRGYAERNAINAPLQGSAADIIKIAMIAIYKSLKEKGLKSRMLLQVHDELVFNVYPDELPALQQIVATEMPRAYKGRVPLTVSAGIADNWLEAH